MHAARQLDTGGGWHVSAQRRCGDGVPSVTLDPAGGTSRRVLGGLTGTQRRTPKKRQPAATKLDQTSKKPWERQQQQNKTLVARREKHGPTVAESFPRSLFFQAGLHTPASPRSEPRAASAAAVSRVSPYPRTAPLPERRMKAGQKRRRSRLPALLLFSSCPPRPPALLSYFQGLTCPAAGAAASGPGSSGRCSAAPCTAAGSSAAPALLCSPPAPGEHSTPHVRPVQELK